MKKLITILSVCLLSMIWGANKCTDDPNSVIQRSSCDPLAENTADLELGPILIIGQNAEGIIYLVDEGGPEGYRVFVSNGDTLERREIAGGGIGSSKGLGDNYSFIIRDGDGYFTVLAEIDEDGNAQMAISEGDYEGTIYALGEDGELLTLLETEDIAKLEIANLPGVIEAEYQAQVEDGKWIVVTRPTHDWGYEDFRLFYGSQDEMIEYEIQEEVSRACDGGSTYIYFSLDNQKAEVYFGYQDMEWGPAYLKIGDTKQSVTRLEPNYEQLDNFSFMCID